MLIYVKQEKTDKDIIIDYINKNGFINSKIAREILHCEKTWAVKMLSELIDAGLIIREGKSVSTIYKSVHLMFAFLFYLSKASTSGVFCVLYNILI